MSQLYDVRRMKYSAHVAGFRRMNVAGWRFAFIDTSKFRASYSDRTNGWRFGRFIVNVSRIGRLTV